MIQEQKDLLLKDLCARLPYGVKGRVLSSDCNNRKCEFAATINGKLYDRFAVAQELWFDNVTIKPYLFPLSSITEEQKQEYTYIVNYISSDDTENWKEGEFIYVEQFTQLMHFYHINHLDYMGLIPMGLAIDATGLNIY